MALTTIPRRFASNDFKRTIAGDGDIVFAIYDIDVDNDPNAYPAGGEPITFVADFQEVHGVSLCGFGVGAGGPWNNQLYMPVFQRNAVNAGLILMFIGPGGAAGFPQHAVGVYATNFRFSLFVYGRPISDAS